MDKEDGGSMESWSWVCGARGIGVEEKTWGGAHSNAELDASDTAHVLTQFSPTS